MSDQVAIRTQFKRDRKRQEPHPSRAQSEYTEVRLMKGNRQTDDIDHIDYFTSPFNEAHPLAGGLGAEIIESHDRYVIVKYPTKHANMRRAETLALSKMRSNPDAFSKNGKDEKKVQTLDQVVESLPDASDIDESNEDTDS